MKLVGRIPVEPLDDERLTNLERRIVIGAVVAPARAQRRWIGLAAATAAVCAAAAIGWMLHRSDAQLVATSAPLAVHTDAQGSHLDIGDATIASGPATAFAITRPSGGVLIEMSRGRVELEVGKRHDRPALVVRAGETDVIVVGTHFSVDFHDGTGDCDVQVTEGVVRVVRKQLEVRVAKGQEWHARDGRVTATEIAIDIAMPPDVLHGRVAAVPDVAKIANAEKPLHPTEKPAEPIKHIDPPSDPQQDLKTQIRQQAVAPALEVGLEPASAIVRYRQIASSMKRDEAAHAIYSIAVVQSMKLGHDDEALDTLDRLYMHRFEGANDYPAALWLRVRITCLRKIDQDCRQAAYTYINKASDGPARHVAQVLSTTD